MHVLNTVCWPMRNVCRHCSTPFVLPVLVLVIATRTDPQCWEMHVAWVHSVALLFLFRPQSLCQNPKGPPQLAHPLTQDSDLAPSLTFFHRTLVATHTHAMPQSLLILRILMDRITARPYDEVSQDAAEEIQLSNALNRQLPGAKLQVEITEAKPDAKRILLRFSWNMQNGQPLAPLRLTAWVHDRKGEP